MKKLLPHIITFAVILGIFVLTGSEVFAQASSTPMGTPAPRVGVMGWLGNQANQAIAWVALGILNLFAWLVGITGWLLNIAISHLVVGMGELVLKGGFGVTIEVMWRLIRDLMNLCFIFALLYIGIATIVQMGALRVDTKKALASVIISMLLVNFSLYFAKVIIDVANLTSMSVYHTMVNVPGSRIGYINDPKIGITGVFADRIGVASLLVSGTGSAREQILKNVTQEGGLSFVILFSLGASLLLIMLAITFALGAFMLVVRFVTLILLMIFSPIAFLPYEIPVIGKLRDRWWNMLMTQAFVAPVYIFGLYVTLLVLSSAPWNFRGGLAALFTGTNAADMNAGLFALLFFVIGIVMLMATTVAAKGLSSSGAQVSKALTSAAGRGLAGAAATGGFLGRNIGGRIGRRYADSDALKTRAAQGGIGGFVARRQLGAARAAYKGTWDYRNTATVGAAAKAAGVDVGKGTKANYEKRLKDIKDKELKYAESLNLDESPEIAAKKKVVDDHDKRIKDYQRDLKTAIANKDEKEQERIKNSIQLEREEKEEAQKEVTEAKSKNQASYANVVEEGQLGWIGLKGRSIFPFRTRVENKKAGEHVRENIKKKKNKNNTDRITEALEKSAEKK